MNLLAILRNSILPIQDINRALPDRGHIYELGCGYGTLALEIAKYSSFRQVTAIDLNEEKISNASIANKLKNLKYKVQDVMTFPYHSFHGAVLSDFLHHIDYSTQKKLIQILSKSMHPDGVLIIKEIDNDDGWRKILSRLWDFVLYPKDTIYYRSKYHWLTLLKSMGYEISVKRKSILFPGSTYLFICTKK